MPETPARPVIVLELNELCPPLLDRWMVDGSLPNFKRLHDGSDVFQTQADVTEPDKLEPWIQWYSIHTGLSYDQHGVYHLTDGARAEHQDIWRAAIAAGRTACSFASMNVRPFAAPGSLFVGDPWTENGDAHPPELNVYNRFVGHNVREYSNSDAGLTASDYAAFLRFLLTHGLSAGTAWRTVRQLADEKLRDPHLSYRRVAILDALQFDVFAHYYRVMRPHLATFFVNSVAHLQHSYWRYMEPDAFQVQPDGSERARYGDAIKFGYVAMDWLIGRVLKLADRHGTTLVFQTALSQQPFLKYEAKGGQRFFRLRDVQSFLREAGVSYLDVDPTMTHQFMATFGSDEARAEAERRLSCFEYEDGRKLIDSPPHDTPNALYFGAQVPNSGDLEALVTDQATGRTFPASEVVYELDGTKSGCHHPVGALWIRRGTHRKHEELVSILDTFPTMLDLLGIADESSARTGRSLFGPDAQRSAA
ncbi:MAG TPA: hypothetical protein VF631_02960 [Allosphingosinicella sp.]|jgi:hypothetical protein|uniref:hypothetical protein n=1 Tax=Allosphingosinicella sp. TaxID=2823234 RepID=UPI002F2A7CBA